MRNIIFFYYYCISDAGYRREGRGSVWLKYAEFPSNTKICENICDNIIIIEPDIKPHHISITNWKEMPYEDFMNFVNVDTIHKTAIDSIGEGIVKTYCGLEFDAFDPKYLSSNDDFNCPECIAENRNDEIKKLANTIDGDFTRMKKMCSELLAGADKCAKEPHFIVQPFLGIVKRYHRIINKYKLCESEG